MSPRWTALARADSTSARSRTGTRHCSRESRVLVPVDVQALFVEPGATRRRRCALPFALTEPDGQPAAPMPAPFDPGPAQDAGVHLHWAMPDALMRGTLASDARRLDQPARPAGAARPLARAAPARAERSDPGRHARLGALRRHRHGRRRSSVAPASRRCPRRRATPSRRRSSPAASAGSAQWAATYDAVIDRFAFHDPLDDLADRRAERRRPPTRSATSITGWWSHAELDPLDAARTDASLHDLLDCDAAGTSPTPRATRCRTSSVQPRSKRSSATRSG